VFAKSDTRLSGGSEDEVGRAIVRQLQEAVEGMKGPRGGEHARRVAATLRLATTYMAAHGIDAAFDHEVRALAAREGEAAFLAPHRFAGELTVEERLKGWGVSAPRPPRIDEATRLLAVRAMLAEGVSAQVVKIADVFDRIGDRFDRRPTALARLGGDEDDICSETALGQALISAFAAVMCIVHIFLCAVFAGMAAGLDIGLGMFGC
jgi:hypothetical protein